MHLHILHITFMYIYGNKCISSLCTYFMILGNFTPGPTNGVFALGAPVLPGLPVAPQT